MKTKLILLGAICSGALMFAGCVNTLDGRSEMGIPLVKDSVSGRYERPTLEVWAAAKDVLKYNGNLFSEDTLKSTLEGSVDTRTVWIRVEPVDQRLTKVTVQVRTKGGAGDVALAGELDKQIAVRLATGNLTPATKAGTSKN